MKGGIVLLAAMVVLSFFGVANSTIWHVHPDSAVSSIQAGIDSSSHGDTVLVYPETYVENINFNGKNIALGSLFLTTGDTSYISSTIIDGDSSGPVVTFENGEDSTAVITGFTIQNGWAGDGGGIYCYYYSNPSLTNVTISGNTADDGGGIYCHESSPSLTSVTISGNTAYWNGGGIYCYYNSNPSLTDVTINGNTAYGGGGIYCSNSNLSLTDVTISGNTAERDGGGISCWDNSNPIFDSVNRCDIFLNFAASGCDLYASDCPIIDVIVDTFTVLQPDEYFGYPIDNFTFDILNAKIEQISQDLYVSPTGSDDNSGLTPDDPLLTISWALTKIIADSTSPLTIYVSNGIYSQSQTRETFPLNCRSYVSLQGEDEGSTILDGEGLSNILYCENDSDFSIENMTIQNGNANMGGGGISCHESSPSLTNVTINGNTAYGGGGIYCSNSNPSLTNVTISGNGAGNGGGISCEYNSSPSLTNVTISGNTTNDYGGGILCGDNSNPSLTNVTISRNTAYMGGGGIRCGNSSPSLTNVTISGNTGWVGGGILCNSNSSPSLTNVIISGNSALGVGGGICCENSSPSLTDVTISGNATYFGYGGGIFCEYNSNPIFDSVNRCDIFLNFATTSGCDLYASDCPIIDVIVDTFTVLQPDDFFAYPIDNFTFDILNAKIEQISQDLYVSPTGSDDNSGLTPDDPLLTISCALMKIVADSTNPHTIHLANGVYSPSQTGERFPLFCRSYVSLQGEDEVSTILDAEESGTVLYSRNDNDFSIRNITIQNGRGGIYCWHSSPSLANVTIAGNTAYDGGGIYCDNSNPSLTDVTISGNTAYMGGGGISCCYNSSPSLTNVTISGNTADDGGGIYCRDNSNPSLTNVTISGNTARCGGGISCTNSSPSLTNVTIGENTAHGLPGEEVGSGAGICSKSNSSPSLTNVTISGNTAYDYGGGIYCEWNSNPSLVNCILWNDAPQEVYFYGLGSPNSMTISYSDIQGDSAGIVTNDNGTVCWLEGNINEDPMFVSGPLSDYHLCPFTPSPCIDAGNPDPMYNDPENPLIPGYAMWPALGTVRNDMGVYGGPGTKVWTGIEEESEDFVATSFSLKQNYPNPFNAGTNIQFSLPKSTPVSIKVYDSVGRLVKTLVDAEKSAGGHQVYWDGTSQRSQKVSAGVYFCKLSAGDFTSVKKMILLR